MSETVIDPRAAKLLRMQQAKREKCEFCGARLNSFNRKRCPKCHLDQPTGPVAGPVGDTPAETVKALTPVRSRPPFNPLRAGPATVNPLLARIAEETTTEPPPAETPTVRKGLDPDTTAALKEFAADVRRERIGRGDEEDPADAPEPEGEPRICPTCGEPLHANGRCYACRPPRRADLAAKPAGLPETFTIVPSDPELAAIAAVLSAVAGLDGPARRRVFDYARARHGDA